MKKEEFYKSLLELKKICEESERCPKCPLYNDHQYCMFSKFPRFWHTKRIAEIVEKLYNK